MDFFVIAYAAIIAVGGFIGFVKAGSATSMIMGGTFAALISYFEYKRKFWLVFACALTLATVMGYRSLNSGKFFPAGVVALLSGLMIINLLAKYARQRL